MQINSLQKRRNRIPSNAISQFVENRKQPNPIDTPNGDGNDKASVPGIHPK